MAEQKYIFQLREIISIDTLEKILMHFSEATSLPAIVTDYCGRRMTAMNRFNPSCKQCRESPDVVLCEKCDAYGGLEASFKGSPVLYKCHLGFLDAAVPIIVDGNYIGAILTGQIRVEEQNMEQFSCVLSEDTGVKKHAPERESVRMPLKKFESCTQLLFTMANHFAEIGARSMIQKELNEQKIKLLQESKSQMELKKNLARMELKNMQSQMNPHFLFNTLNVIHHLAVLEDAAKTSETISALSELLRWRLKNSNELVTIGDEINYIKSYLLIKSVTLRDRVKVQCDFDEAAQGCLIPPYTLQPLVENAFLHGLEPKEEGGTIKIGISRRDERVLMKIEDDGIGMSGFILEELLKLRQKESKLTIPSLGIRNVIKTLSHYFGDKFEWDLESRQGIGTKISLCIPYWEDKKEESS
ncbi:sensor histidine kinase [Caproiciproducens sp.]